MDTVKNVCILFDYICGHFLRTSFSMCATMRSQPIERRFAPNRPDQKMCTLGYASVPLRHCAHNPLPCVVPHHPHHLCPAYEGGKARIHCVFILILARQCIRNAHPTCAGPSPARAQHSHNPAKPDGRPLFHYYPTERTTVSTCRYCISVRSLTYLF